MATMVGSKDVSKLQTAFVSHLPTVSHYRRLHDMDGRHRPKNQNPYFFPVRTEVRLPLGSLVSILQSNCKYPLLDSQKLVQKRL